MSITKRKNSNQDRKVMILTLSKDQKKNFPLHIGQETRTSFHHHHHQPSSQMKSNKTKKNVTFSSNPPSVTTVESLSSISEEVKFLTWYNKKELSIFRELVRRDSAEMMIEEGLSSKTMRGNFELKQNDTIAVIEEEEEETIHPNHAVENSSSNKNETTMKRMRKRRTRSTNRGLELRMNHKRRKERMISIKTVLKYHRRLTCQTANGHEELIRRLMEHSLKPEDFLAKISCHMTEYARVEALRVGRQDSFEVQYLMMLDRNDVRKKRRRDLVVVDEEEKRKKRRRRVMSENVTCSEHCGEAVVVAAAAAAAAVVSSGSSSEESESEDEM